MKNTVLNRSVVFKAASALALLAFILFGIGFATAGQSLKLTVLHMNDPHAHYLPYTEKDDQRPIGGFAKAQTVLKGVRDKNGTEGRETLIFLAGDLLMGTPFSTAFKGELGVKLLNKMGINAMAVGNHEFDYGQENLLLRLRPLMEFPLLSANIRTAGGESLFERVLVKEASSSPTRIAVFGLTTKETPITTHPGNVEGLVFDDPIQTAKSILERYDDSDLIIAVTHIGVEEDKQLAAACPKIDVIVGGHSHTALFEPIKVGDTLIVQAGAYSRYVGQLDLDAVDGKVVKYNGQLIALAPEIEENAEISAIIDEYKTRLNASLKTVIGKTDVDLEGTRSAIRSGRDTNLGRLIAYNMAANSGADLALINGGAIRAGIPAGDITISDVYTVLPFGDKIVYVVLSGEDLQSVLQKSASLETGSGAKFQTFGLAYQAEGGRVKIDKIRGEAFDPTKTYRVAIDDFLAAGGDGYTVFKEKGKDLWNTSTLLSDVLIDYIKSKKVITEALLQEIEKRD